MATSIKLDDELSERVRRLADLRQCSPHWVMCEAIRQYVEREEAREGFTQAAVASWKAYRETGAHLTGEEVRSWLNGWGSDDETDAPECHG